MRALAVVGALTIATGSAHADDAERTAVLITDGTADALLIGALFGESETIGVVGAVAYLVGGPIIHARYGRWAQAGASLAIRGAAPVVLGYLACRVFGDPDGGATRGGGGRDPDLACLIGGLGGVVVGIAGAELVDWSVLTDPSAPPIAAAQLLTFGGRF